MAATDAAIAAAFDSLLALQGRAVTYRRGPQSTALTAVKSVRRIEGIDASGAAVLVEKTDWLVRASDLTLGGLAAAPEEGDQVEETIGAAKATYEAMPDGKEPHGRYADAARTWWRIHVKLVSEE